VVERNESRHYESRIPALEKNESEPKPRVTPIKNEFYDSYNGKIDRKSNQQLSQSSF
jgi:hypothetical protein